MILYHAKLDNSDLRKEHVFIWPSKKLAAANVIICYSLDF